MIINTAQNWAIQLIETDEKESLKFLGLTVEEE